MKKKNRQRPHQGDRFKTIRKNPDGTREVVSRFAGIAPRTHQPIYS